MNDTTAGLSRRTLDGIKEGLFAMSVARMAKEREAEKLQDQIDGLEEEREEVTVLAAEFLQQGRETGSLLADRFRKYPRFTLYYEEYVHAGDVPLDLYDLWEEETLRTFTLDEVDEAREAVTWLEALRASNPHPYETVEHWVEVNRP